MTNDSNFEYDAEIDPFGDVFASNDGLLVTDSEGFVVFKNEVFRKIWDLSEEDLENRKLVDCAENISALIRSPKNIFETVEELIKNKNQVVHTELFLKNGKVVDVHTFPMIGADNAIHGRIFYFKDITEEKRIEDLRNLQSLMLDNLATGIALARATDDTIVYTNLRFEEMFGYEQDELIGKHVSVLNAPFVQSPEEVAKEITDAVRTKGEWRGIVQNIKKDLSLIWTRTVVSGFNHSEYGKVWVSMQDDITDSIVAEGKVTRYESRFQKLFENSLEPMLLITVGGRIMEANSKACELLGRSVQELRKIGREGVVDFSDGRWSELQEERKRTGGYSGMFTVIHKSGQRIEVEGSSATFIDSDGLEQSHVILRNVSKEKSMQAKLEERELLYNELFETDPDPIVIFDSIKWKVLTANKAAIERLGFSNMEELIASGGPESFSLGVQPDGLDSKVLVKKMLKKLNSEDIVSFPWWHETRAGERYRILVILSKIVIGGKTYIQAKTRRVV